MGLSTKEQIVLKLEFLGHIARNHLAKFASKSFAVAIQKSAQIRAAFLTLF